MSMQPINNSNVNRFEKTGNSVSKQFSGSSNPEVLKESTEVLTQALDTASTVAKAVLNIKKENGKMPDTYKEPVVRKIDIDLCREHLEILDRIKNNDNAYKSMDDFKNAGGVFEKGKALVNGEPFSGIIKLEMKGESEAEKDDFRAPERYAIFNKNGNLEEVLTYTTDYNKRDSIVVQNPNSSVANILISTETITTDAIHFQGYEAVLDKYNIE